jgi:GDP-L-fucose synthase
MSKYKTLVTGGTGMVGSAINADIKIGSKDCDLRDPHAVDTLFAQNQPQNVIHCAAKVGGVGSNMLYKGQYFYDNIMINTNVIESARKHNVKNLVCFLSTCVFPDNVKYPLTIDQIHQGEPHSSNYPYAYSKRMADIQIRAYKEQYNLNYKSVIPCNIYGPNDNFNVENGHVLPALIHKCYLAKQNNTPLHIWGSGLPLREFIYSKDVAVITEWILQNYEGSEPIILSTSEEISIKQLVEIVVKEMKFDGKVIFDTSKPEGQFRKPSDNSKLKELIPSFKFTPLEIGLQETIEWFVSNYQNAKK